MTSDAYTTEDVFGGLGIEISLKSPDDFLKVKETLTRIGIPSSKDKTLYQSCHILHKRGKYAILHFKELFILDGANADISDRDLERRNTITELLSEWDLLEILDDDFEELEKIPKNHIKVISYADKKNWTLQAKYTIGKK